MSEENAWYETGQQAVDNANKKGGGGGGGSWRFYIKPGQEAKIAFLDGDNSEEEPVLNYREHQYDQSGVNAPMYATCVGAAQGCMFCKAGLRAYEAWPFTILVIEPVYKDRDGNEHPFQRKLMVAKKEIMQRILRFMQQREGLTGTVWTLYRSTKKAYTIGDDWQFQEKIGKSEASPEERRKAMAAKFEIEEDKCERIDYVDELKPKSEDELLAEGADIEATKARAEQWTGGGGGGGGSRGGSSGGGGGRDAGVDYK